jgi:hypothetical protein
MDTPLNTGEQGVLVAPSKTESLDQFLALPATMNEIPQRFQVCTEGLLHRQYVSQLESWYYTHNLSQEGCEMDASG